MKEADPTGHGGAVWVVGVGTMGRQIALRCALAGHRVCQVGPSRATRESAWAFQTGWLDAAAARGDITAAQAQSVPDSLQMVSDMDQARFMPDLVIETVPEDLALKRRVFAQLDRTCPPSTILATNSSSIPISKLEDATSRPDKVANMHFHFPLRTPGIVEVMAGSVTAEDALRFIAAFVMGLGLIPLRVRRESKGFIFNRVWRAVTKECLRVVDEGVAPHEDVDRAWMAIVGTSIGPFGLMDGVGLDVVGDIEVSCHQESGDPCDLAPRLLVDRVEQGRLGIKSGEGFYHYPHPAFAEPSFLQPPVDPQVSARRVKASDLIGTWRLVAWENRDEDGTTEPAFGAGVSGYLIYTAQGYVAAHLMAAGRRPFASPDVTAATPEEACAALQTCLSYAGRFSLSDNRLSHHVDVCTFPNWVGTTLERVVELQDNRLVISTARAPFRGRMKVSMLAWERL